MRNSRLAGNSLWMCALVLVLGVCRADPTPATAGAPALIAIRAGHLIDVVSGRTLNDQVILIRAAKIEAVGPEVRIPPEAQDVDLSQMTVLPGLVNCHTHLADLANAQPLDLLRKTEAQMAYEPIPNARVPVLAGVTTVRDVGVYRAFNDVAMRDAIAKGIIIGPRM